MEVGSLSGPAGPALGDCDVTAWSRVGIIKKDLLLGKATLFLCLWLGDMGFSWSFFFCLCLLAAAWKLLQPLIQDTMGGHEKAKETHSHVVPQSCSP